MTNKISRCNSCGKFFDSKRELKNHIDKNHRITNSKMNTMMIIPEILTKPDSEFLPTRWLKVNNNDDK